MEYAIRLAGDNKYRDLLRRFQKIGREEVFPFAVMLKRRIIANGSIPFREYWWFYGLFTSFVLLMLALDLGVFHRKAHVSHSRKPAIWSVVWVTLALAFNYVLYRYALWKFPQDERLLAIPGFHPGHSGVERLARVPHGLHRRKIAIGRQHLHLRDGVRLFRDPGRSISIVCFSTAFSARLSSGRYSSRWARR